MGAMVWALDMANFENVPVQLQEIEMEHVSMLWSVFMNEVLSLVKVPPPPPACPAVDGPCLLDLCS